MKPNCNWAALAAFGCLLPVAAHAAKTKPLAAAAPQSTKWAESFAPTSLGTYLDSEGTAVLVAGPGDSTKDAARALVEALRATGKTRLVVDDRSLGNLSDASDADIVGKARGSPVDMVAVVRVFPASAEKQPSAVVTFFSKKSGSTLSAFTVARGTPVSPRSVAAAVPTAALDSVVPATEAPQKESKDPAVEKFMEERAIWTQSDVLVNVYTGAASVSRGSDFFRGKNGPRLEGAALYEYLGREDLAASYRSWHSLERTLEWGGLAGLVLVGPGLMVTGAIIPGSCTTKDSVSNTCTGNLTNPLIYVGLGVTTVGLVAALIGLFMNPNPVSTTDVFQMVDAFNDDLRKKAPSTATSSRADPDSPKVALRLDSFAVRGGGGLSLGLTF
jgi:hypothetical protein